MSSRYCSRFSPSQQGRNRKLRNLCNRRLHPTRSRIPIRPQRRLLPTKKPATFKVNVKLVTVRVVVRDAQGHAVGNLHKEDFNLFDNGKPQVISHFSVEQPGTQAAKERQTSDEKAGEKLPSVPEHYIAFVFDDIHIKFGDLVRSRTAAERHIATLLPTDRAAIFTTSGQTTLDFTDDRAKLHDTLLRLQPRPIAGTGIAECPDISYYMADLIQNKNDIQAEQAAVQDALGCSPLPCVAEREPAGSVTNSSHGSACSGSAGARDRKPGKPYRVVGVKGCGTEDVPDAGSAQRGGCVAGISDS